MTNSANHQIPTVGNHSNAVIVQAIETKILSFPVRVEMYRDDEGPAQIQCDSFLGMCEGCGTPAYGSDSPRVVDGEITCPVCLAEERTWRKAVQPAVYEVAA